MIYFYKDCLHGNYEKTLTLEVNKATGCNSEAYLKPYYKSKIEFGALCCECCKFGGVFIY